MTSRRKRGLALAVLLLVGGALAYYFWPRRPEPISAEAGRAYFHDRDLGSPYHTGIPYALALATMERHPELLGGNRDEFCDKFGVLFDPDKPDGLPVGFVLHHDRRTGADFVMTNCSLCHTGLIDGQFVTGLGNRNLRINALNQAIKQVAGAPDFNADTLLPAAEAAAARRGLSWGWRQRAAVRAAVRKLQELATSEASAWAGLDGVDAGPGRNTAIEFAKGTSGVPVAPPYGFAKYPVVWTYPLRRTFGWDGSLAGDHALGLAAVEFNKGMPPEDILHGRERWYSLFEYLKTIRPPRYPRPIDQDLAARGAGLFGQHCSGCHGTYGPDGAESYQETVIDLGRVKTDPDRLRAVSPELIEARRRGPFAQLVWLEPTRGYVPPPLEGIWCRGPYLHNGSVPTLADLLRPAAERPVLFYTGGDTGYDFDRVGLPYQEERAPGGKRAGRRSSAKQFPFDTRGPGNGNGGHEFGTRLAPEDRRALLEYLKGL
jgi:mono/diheme cytochrome c family protein